MALPTGQLLNQSDLARDVGISGSTAGALRKIATQLPADAVASITIFCRTPSPFPLDEEVAAAPLEGLALTPWA